MTHDDGPDSFARCSLAVEIIAGLAPGPARIPARTPASEIIREEFSAVQTESPGKFEHRTDKAGRDLPGASPRPSDPSPAARLGSCSSTFLGFTANIRQRE